MIIRHGTNELKLPGTPSTLSLLYKEVFNHFGFEQEDYQLFGAKNDPITRESDYVYELNAGLTNEYILILNEKDAEAVVVDEATPQPAILVNSTPQGHALVSLEDEEEEKPKEEEDPKPAPPRNYDTSLPTHLYTFDLRARELRDFDSQTQSVTKRSYNFGGVFEDSAWCVTPSNSLFVCGGSMNSGKSALKNAGELNLGILEYSAHTDMSFGRSYHAVICIGNDVFAMGGHDEFNVGQSSMEGYDLETQQWNQLEDMPKPLYKASVTTFDNKTIFFTDMEARSIFSYNVERDEYSRIRVAVPQHMNKTICAFGPDNIVVISNNEVAHIEDGVQSKKKDLSKSLNDVNVNCPCFVDNGVVYFVNDFQEMQYSLSSGAVGTAG